MGSISKSRKNKGDGIVDARGKNINLYFMDGEASGRILTKLKPIVHAFLAYNHFHDERFQNHAEDGHCGT